MKQVGVIGLGTVGSHYLDRLREKGHAPFVFDIEPAKVDRAIEGGAKRAEHARGVAEASDVIVLTLPSDQAVLMAMEGPDGVAEALGPGKTVVDTSTSRLETETCCAELCEAKGAGFIEAPITFRRSEGVIMMAAGPAGHFEAAREALEQIAYKVERVGPLGHGQLMKLVNQMVLANQLAIEAEAVQFCRSVGLDPTEVADYLELGHLSDGIKRMAAVTDFAAAGRLRLHYRDLLNVVEAAHQHRAPIPVTSVVHEIFKATAAYGDADWGQLGIATHWQRLAGPEQAGG